MTKVKRNKKIRRKRKRNKKRIKKIRRKRILNRSRMGVKAK